MIYNLHFEGSLSDTLKQRLPVYSGIYLVYRGKFDAKDKLFYCKEILYIGQAVNIRDRVANHERRNDFYAQLRKDESIFYSYAQVDSSILNKIENALIYTMKPCLNSMGKDSYQYSAIHVVSDGACALLASDIEISV